MTSEEVLVRLAEAAADAVAEALHGFAGDKVERGAAAVVQPGTSPFAGISPPVVVAKVDYVDGITGGNIFHGEMSVDQMFMMRPLAGSARYKMPVPGLYLCGSGAHPGGGVMGAPGYNAARAILKAGS